MKKKLPVLTLFFVYRIGAASFESFDNLLDILLRKPMTNIPAPANIEIEGATYNLSNFTQRKNAFAKMRNILEIARGEIVELRNTAQAEAGEAEGLQEELAELTRRNDEEKVALQAELKRVRDEYAQFRRTMSEHITASQTELRNRLDRLRAD